MAAGAPCAAAMLCAMALALALAAPAHAKYIQIPATGVPTPYPAGDGAVQSGFSPDPFLWWNAPLAPVAPEVGGKLKLTMYVANQGGTVIPKGTVLSVWANKTESVSCGQTADADAEYKLPQIAPMQTITLKVTVPFSSGTITANNTASVLFFLDSQCASYNNTDSENQSTVPVYVLPKNTDYVQLVVPNTSPSDLPYGLYHPSRFEQLPIVPEAGGLYTLWVPVMNTGTAPSPKGVFMQVWSVFPEDYDYDSCNNTGGVLVELPKINPGKVKTIKVEGLVARTSNEGLKIQAILVDAKCALGTAPRATAFPVYEVAPSPSAAFGGVQAKDQLTFAIKTAPKAPKVNGTMSVKVKFVNEATTEGAIGQVGVWLVPAAESNSLYFGGYMGQPCAYQGFAATADFSGVVVKGGKSKTVTIKDVTVPGPPGWWQVSAVPDINCTLPASSTIQPVVPYAAFEVVA
ncbi:hypothetical protein Rsub_02491 [Raphidocelis subcapitata]|uniref:CARDB domain-containing protein n=1 Tax=Raphidocelis subcapitata TaxID=307507 RepID=A0A2V0NZY6_9CHLO|nr:hypothetical protein Rsub_02491 [Raphidocelis subcapitata]|eukprot:GBF90385.1 hypothetical protein Rsub_02491 [Raphidocelis subcapitata]